MSEEHGRTPFPTLPLGPRAPLLSKVRVQRRSPGTRPTDPPSTHTHTHTMGVPGLLPALKDVSGPTHISAFAGSAVAVDAYSWLHKGSYSCARELCEGVPTQA